MNDLPKCCYRISLKTLVWNEDRTKLLVVKTNEGYWDFPGGGIDWGETVHDCIHREIKEEIGLEVTSISSHPVYFFTHVNELVKYAYPMYEVTLKDLNFTPSSECVEIQFATPSEILQMHTKPNLKDFFTNHFR